MKPFSGTLPALESLQVHRETAFFVYYVTERREGGVFIFRKIFIPFLPLLYNIERLSHGTRMSTAAVIVFLIVVGLAALAVYWCYKKYKRGATTAVTAGK